MFSSTRRCRFALIAVRLMCAAIVLASVSAARADSITYNLTPYTLPDANGSSVTDTITGSITFSSSVGSVLGTYTVNGTPIPVATASISMFSSSLGLIVDSGIPTSCYVGAGELILTPTVMYVAQPGNTGDALTLYWQSGQWGKNSYSTIIYDWYGPGFVEVQSYAWLDGNYINPIDGYNYPYPFTLGVNEPGPGDFTFATAAPVPEPASLTLLISALLGL